MKFRDYLNSVLQDEEMRKLWNELDKSYEEAIKMHKMLNEDKNIQEDLKISSYEDLEKDMYKWLEENGTVISK